VAFGTVDQKDVVAAGTVRKCWFCRGEESVSAVSQQSSVISPELKVSDPMLEVGDGRCAGEIPQSHGCVASRPHEHTPGGAVPTGTVSVSEVTKRLMASQRIHQRWPGVPKIFQEFWSVAPQGVEDEKVFLCAKEFYLVSWEALLNVPLFWGEIMDLPLTQGGSPAEGEHAENSTERFLAPREVSKGSVPFVSAIAADLVPFIPQNPQRGEEAPKLPDQSGEGWWFAR